MITSSAIEPGSSAKIFNTALALETGKITPFSQFDARFPLKIGRFTIHDFNGKGTMLNLTEVLKYSSNIGSGRIAMAVGSQKQKKFLKHIGLLDAVECELLETQRPIYPSTWTEAGAITIAFGHGIAVSPLHLITVVSGILNDGIARTPTLLKRDIAIGGKRIVSHKTSQQLKAMLRLCVIEGTNRFAEVKGYCVGGKSGTAEKQRGGRYLKHSNYCGFIGAFPMTSPKYSVYVVLDEPKASAKTFGYATAGWNATPTAARIIARIGPMLGIIASTNHEPDWHEILRQHTFSSSSRTKSRTQSQSQIQTQSQSLAQSASQSASPFLAMSLASSSLPQSLSLSSSPSSLLSLQSLSQSSSLSSLLSSKSTERLYQ
jgi:cell division protein FtsI (penicillin-binding protein 3)